MSATISNPNNLISIKEITSALAYYAILQSPYPCPDKLQEVIEYLHGELQKRVTWNDLGWSELSDEEIKKILFDILYDKGVEPFDAWNRSRKGPESGVLFTTRYDGPLHPDFDFIDIDALLRNTWLLIVRTRRRKNESRNDEFDTVRNSESDKVFRAVAPTETQPSPFPAIPIP